jgi:hypothetical protein
MDNLKNAIGKKITSISQSETKIWGENNVNQEVSKITISMEDGTSIEFFKNDLNNESNKKNPKENGETIKKKGILLDALRKESDYGQTPLDFAEETLRNVSYTLASVKKNMKNVEK